MHIDWATLGIWFLAAIGFFVAGYIFLLSTGWGTSGAQGETIIYMMGQWIFVTGVVRSTNSWNLPICWMTGLVLLPAVCLLISAPVLLCSAFGWWSERGRKK